MERNLAIIMFNVTCVMFGEIPGGMGEQRGGILGSVQGRHSKGGMSVLKPEGKLGITTAEEFSRYAQAQETTRRVWRGKQEHGLCGSCK